MNCHSYEYQKPYIRSYQTKNKEELRIIRSQRYHCPCGSNIRISDLAKHKRTQRHKSFEIPLLNISI